MSSCSGWMVATMSRIGPLRGRSISSRSSELSDPLPLASSRRALQGADAEPSSSSS